NGILRRLGGGWKLSGIVRLSSGSPLSITPGTDRALTGTGDQRVDYLDGDVYHADKNIAHWFNAAAFAPAPVGQYGNLGRNTIRVEVRFLEIRCLKHLALPVVVEKRRFSRQLAPPAPSHRQPSSASLPNPHVPRCSRFWSRKRRKTMRPRTSYDRGHEHRPHY